MKALTKSVQTQTWHPLSSHATAAIFVPNLINLFKIAKSRRITAAYASG